MDERHILAQALWLTLADTGVEVERYEPTDNGLIFYISVPSRTYEGISSADLARGAKTLLQRYGITFYDFRYRVRNEEWTFTKAAMAVAKQRDDLGL